MKLRRTAMGAAGMLAAVFLAGCSIQKIDLQKQREIPYERVEKEDVPEELWAQIGQERNPFRMTYADGGKLYLARGYGEQSTDGYQVQVTGLYETENALALYTDLEGPDPEEQAEEGSACPWVVIQIEYSDKYVWME